LNDAILNENNRNKRKTYDDSVFDLSKIDQGRCNGFKIENFDNDSLYSNFPFQLLNSKFNSRDLGIVLESTSFHSLSCYSNNYLCPSNLSANKECSNLAFNNDFNKISNRMREVASHTNYKYLNYNQLIDVIQYYVELNNNSKLNQLNNQRTILALRNKITLFKRFVFLLQMNEVPRIHVLIKNCINRGCGVNGILEKFKLAANLVYKPKQWSQTEKDLGLLILRVGGPSLLKPFTNLNMLPTSSYLYKVNNF